MSGRRTGETSASERRLLSELIEAGRALRSVGGIALAPLVFQLVFVVLAGTGWPRAGAEHRLLRDAPVPFLVSSLLVSALAAAALVLACAGISALSDRRAQKGGIVLVALLASLPIPMLAFFVGSGTLPSLDLAREGLPFLLRDATGWGRAGAVTLACVAVPWALLSVITLHSASAPPRGPFAPLPLASAGLLLLGAVFLLFAGGNVLAHIHRGSRRAADSRRQLLTCLFPSFPLLPALGADDVGAEALVDRLARELPPRSELARYLSSLASLGAASRPNVVIVMLEGVPAGHVSFRGYRRTTTPNLDRLAATGVSFDRAWAAANESKNGQTAILASVYPMRAAENNFVSNALDYPRILCWEVFGALGFTTAFISTQDETWLGMQRFQLLDGRPPDLYTHALDIPEGETFPDRKKDEAPVVRRALDWMRRVASSRRPFFLVTNFQRTHFPYQLPSGITPSFEPLAPLGPRFRRWTEADLPNGVNNFDSALRYVDDRLGELLAGLRDLGIEKDTIVAVVSDHGQGFEAGLEPVSMSLDAPYVHVPFVVSWPGTLPAGRREEDVSTIDLFPTLLGLIGAPPCPGWDGRDRIGGPAAPLERSRPIYSASIVWEARWLVRGGGAQVLIDLMTGRATAHRRDESLRFPVDWSSVGEAPALLQSFLEDYSRRAAYYTSPDLRRSRLYAEPAGPDEGAPSRPH